MVVGLRASSPVGSTCEIRIMDQELGEFLDGEHVANEGGKTESIDGSPRTTVARFDTRLLALRRAIPP
jgi:hypothetical protein